MWFVKLMRDAAYVRHAILVLALHGYDQKRWLQHKQFVDAVYAPFI